MGKFTKIDNYEEALKIVVANIDPKKFDIPITETILRNNSWEEARMDDTKDPIDGWVPVLPQVYDETLGDWVEQDEDFNDVFIWYRASKDAWCYKYCFGTYVYNIKSIGELEIIIAREGFVYSFDV